MKKKFVIGMSGPSGAGKTTIGKKLAKKLKAKLINLDDYWKYHNTKINLKKDWKKLEHPSSIDFNKLYNDIIKSKEDSKQKKFILVEGFHLFYNKKIRNLFDLCIYITVPDHLVVKRRVDKFGPEQNQEWYSKNIVIKCYKKYGEPTKKHADLIIRGEENINKNIKKILACLKK